MKSAAVIGLAVLVMECGSVSAFAQDTPQSNSNDPALNPSPAVQDVTLPMTQVGSPVEKVLQSGLMSKYADGKFHAERGLTRAELAAIIAKTFKLSEREATVTQPIMLKDVPSNYWGSSDIYNVLSHDIMTGYRDGYFYPEQRVSRAEALSIFSQAYGVYQYDDATVESILSHYPDSNQVPGWARKALATSLKYGFVEAAPSAKIRPLQPMTRGDMAYALSQYLNRLSQSEQQTLH